jgi:hypothetical protein
MKQEEREAFAAAYANNVAHLNSDEVMAFLESYYTTDDRDYSGDYTSIVDALGMWRDAIYYAKENLILK